MKKRMALMGIGLGVMILSEGAVWASSDAGVQLNQDRTFFERQQIERQLEEALLRDREGMIEQVAPSDTEASQNDITFVLSDIVFDASAVLSAEELNPQIRGKMHLFDSEDQGRYYRKNIDREIIKAYREALKYATGRIESYCAARGAYYMLVGAEDGFGDIFFGKMINIGVLK